MQFDANIFFCFTALNITLTPNNQYGFQDNNLFRDVFVLHMTPTGTYFIEQTVLC